MRLLLSSDLRRCLGEVPETMFVVTYSPSNKIRHARMRSWLNPLSDSLCVAELPGVTPSNFSVAISRDSFSGAVKADVFLNTTNEHLFRLALGRSLQGGPMHLALSGKTVCSGFNHLRALRCFTGRSCHPCFATTRARWVVVLEDDVQPQKNGAPAPAAQLPSLLHALFRGLQNNSFFAAVNKIQLATRPRAVCKAGCASPSPFLAQQWPQACLRRCRGFHDSHGYAMRRGHAKRVVGIHLMLLSGSTDCTNPWHSADGSCGNDPVLLNNFFGQCSHRAQQSSRHAQPQELSEAAPARAAGCAGLSLGSAARYATLFENNTVKRVTRDEETRWGGPAGVAVKWMEVEAAGLRGVVLGFCGTNKASDQAAAFGSSQLSLDGSRCLAEDHSILSLAACIARCVECGHPCRFATFSGRMKDCSLYSKCDLSRVKVGYGYLSVDVSLQVVERGRAQLSPVQGFNNSEYEKEGWRGLRAVS